jgi:hypothetical protein
MGRPATTASCLGSRAETRSRRCRFRASMRARTLLPPPKAVSFAPGLTGQFVPFSRDGRTTRQADQEPAFGAFRPSQSMAARARDSACAPNEILGLFALRAPCSTLNHVWAQVDMFNMIGVCTYDRQAMRASREARQRQRMAGGSREDRLSPRERSHRAEVCVGRASALGPTSEPRSEADAEVLLDAAFELSLSGGFRRIFPTASTAQCVALRPARALHPRVTALLQRSVLVPSAHVRASRGAVSSRGAEKRRADGARAGTGT